MHELNQNLINAVSGGFSFSDLNERYMRMNRAINGGEIPDSYVISACVVGLGLCWLVGANVPKVLPQDDPSRIVSSMLGHVMCGVAALSIPLLVLYKGYQHQQKIALTKAKAD